MSCTVWGHVIIASAPMPQLAARACALGLYDEPIEAAIDLSITHKMAVELDLMRLLTAPNDKFIHDVAGIRNLINRQTGRLTSMTFRPRYAKVN